MKKISIFTVTIIILSCSYNTGYLRNHQPANRLDISIYGKTALVRTLHADIYVRHVDETIEKKISGSYCYNAFENSEESVKIKNLPVDIFMIIIRNRTKNAITGLNTSILYSGNTVNSLTLESISKEKLYYVYNDIDLRKIMNFRRIFTSETDIEKLNFDKDTADFRFNAILPDDTIIFSSVFKTSFNENARYKLQVEYICENLKKVIDFDFTYFEYRFDSDEYHEYLDNLKKEKEDNSWR